MKARGRGVAAVVVTGVWVNASEYLRNEVLLKRLWVEHYRSLGLTFPAAPVNGALWVAWGFLFAGGLYALSRRFDAARTALLGWFLGFVLMWVVAWNLKVLPVGLLPYAVPLSLLEAGVGALLCARIAPAGGRRSGALTPPAAPRPR